MGTWRGSMLAALVATLGRPPWWSMALAAFLVRGGILVVLLPLIVLPTPAALATAFAPTVEALAFGGLTPERLLVVLALGATLFVVLGGTGLAGSWLDLAQLREAAADEDLRLGWEPANGSAREGLSLRLTAHLPTLAVLGYAVIRLVAAAYDELLSPGDIGTPVSLRVAGRAADAVALLLATWLAAEAVGGLAARRAAAGERARRALWGAIRQAASPRGLATLLLTTTVVALVLVPFLAAAGAAWSHLRSVLIADAGLVSLAAALLVLVATWILGLTVLGLVLAWRGAAWTTEMATARRAEEAPPGARAEAAAG